MHCPSLAYFAFALLAIGCSRPMETTSSDPQALTSPGIQKEWVRDVGYRPVLSGQIERESTINKDLSCVQWVRFVDGEKSAEALEFHQTACPNDETALSDDSLAFRVFLNEKESADWGTTYSLYQFKSEGEKYEVGQVQLSNSAGARLEDLCQFTNQTTGAPFANACEVKEADNAWKSIEFKTAVVAVPTSPTEPSSPETVPDENTEQELVRR
jgi:hypothetical protein